MADRVFVTGASGFIGRTVVAELLGVNAAPVALIHRHNPFEAEPRVQTARADLLDPAALSSAVAGCAAAIHLVGIIAERPADGVTFDRLHVQATAAVVQAAQSAGVGRLIHMSALGARPAAASAYHRTKFAAEEIVRASGLRWTIFRPSMVLGRDGEFMRMEVAWARRQAMPYLFMPYFGRGLLGLGGSGRVQPVAVNDVARAFVGAMDNPAAVGRTYDLVGPAAMTWPELHKAISTAEVGYPRATAPMPGWLARALAAAGLGRALGFTRDQVIMALEDNTGNPGPFRTDFGWSPQDAIRA